MEERRITASEVDPVPVSVFLEYAEWFLRQRRLEVCEELVTGLAKEGDCFEVVLEGGDVIGADAVVVTPGMRSFQQLPDWATTLLLERS